MFNLIYEPSNVVCFEWMKNERIKAQAVDIRVAYIVCELINWVNYSHLICACVSSLGKP